MSTFKGAIWLNTLLLLLFCTPAIANTQSVFYFSATCQEAQKHIAALRLVKAEALLAAEAKQHPNNAAVDLLQQTLEFYKLVTRMDFSAFKSLETKFDAHINSAKKIPSNSPYLLYAQSEMYVQWGFLKVFNQEYVGAMFAFRNAYQLANQNVQKFPQFKPSQKTVGMFKALLGSTPHQYHWILNVAGLKGNFEDGMKLIEQSVKMNAHPELILDKQLTVFYYTLFNLNFGDKKVAWEFCETHTDDYPNNLMSCYLRAYTAGKVGQNDEAIRVLQNRPKSPDYEAFYFLDYLLGQCKLNRLDEDADQPLKRFVSFFKGKALVGDAYRRLSWHYLIQNNTDKYKVYRELGKRSGQSGSEEERNIKLELEQGRTPDVILLKARLLFDGGYYSKAEEMIKQRNPESLGTDYQKQEYHYRLGRIYQEQNKWSKATECFSWVIQHTPLTTQYYFAPNASLQLGYIYQKLGFNHIAISHFKRVHTYTKAEYVSSFILKADKELDKLSKE